MKSSPFALAAVIGSFAIAPDVGRCDDDAANRFLTDYSRPASYFSDCQRGHECRGEMTDHQTGGRLVRELECVTKLNGFCLRVTRLKKVPDHGPVKAVDTGDVELGNEAYTGMLRATDSGHALTTIEVYPDRKYSTAPYLYLGVLESNIHKPYDEAVRSGAVTVEEYVRSERHDERQLARIRLSLTVDFPSIKGVKMLNDYYFDPLQDWVCVMVRERSQSELDDQVYEEKRVLPGPDGGESDRFPRVIEKWNVNEKEKKRVLKRSYRMTDVKGRKVDDTEIRLTHFGLPEPVGVVWTKPVPLYVWLLAATGVLAATSLAIRWLQLRSRRNSTVPPSGS